MNSCPNTADIKWMAATRLDDRWIPDTTPNLVVRNGPQSSAPASAILFRLHRHVSDLEQRLSDKFTTQNADLTVTAAIGVLTECHRTLSDVLGCVIELNARYGPSLDVALDVDAVIQWCIAVRLHLDVAFTALVPLAQETPPMP